MTTERNQVSDTGKKTLSLSKGSGKKLGLRRPTSDSGSVKQSFSGGRSKTVQVEVRKKRTRGGAEGGDAPANAAVEAPEEVVAAEAAPPAEAAPVAAEAPREAPAASRPRAERAPAPRDGERAKPRHVLRSLSKEEIANRAKAVVEARRQDEEDRRREAEEAKRRAEEDARLAVEREAAEKRRAEEEARRKAEDESRRKAEEEARKRLDEPEEAAAQPAAAAARPATTERRPAATPERPDRPSRKVPAKQPGPRRGRNEDRRRGGRITVSQALNEDFGQRGRSVAAMRRAAERERRQAQQEALARGEGQKQAREVTIPETITVQELSNRMAVRAIDVIKALMGLEIMATINQTIDADTAELVVEELGHKAKRVSEADVEIGLREDEDPEEVRSPRPPVVTVMGHVDHGKTSLLDALRSTDVVAGEAGGITQHIGAYQVQSKSGKITFIDTPGHAAFTAMRARGAQVTDIVILVVASDDGVMPQTVEAISHAKAAGVPMIVAINKMDKPDANPQRVKTELLQHEVVPEEMGGDVQIVEVSATARTGLDELEEQILLQAEIMELGANPDRLADGVVIEAQLDKGRGPVATVLVQRGTLNVGDIFVAGNEWGRVRAMLDSHGEQVKQAGPSEPVEILGLNGTPAAGDEFTVVESEARAREVADYRQRVARDKRTQLGAPATLEQMFADIEKGDKQQLPVVVKADVQGSVEAIVAAAESLNTEEVEVRVLHAAVGGITESDVTLAQASGAVIMGFSVRANAQARDLAKQNQTEIRYYSVIYELVDDLKAAMSGLLAPKIEETVLGGAEVLEVFGISKIGKIAGCRITEGLVRADARARLIRDDVVIYTGDLKSLRRFQDEAREVREGQECGIGLTNYQDIQKGDRMEFFEVEEIERSL